MGLDRLADLECGVFGWEDLVLGGEGGSVELVLDKIDGFRGGLCSGLIGR
jgi:hypothetical protein